jgi:hypothetical protein
MSNNERRRAGRVALIRDIEYAGEGNRTRRRLTDLGPNGVYIDTTGPLPMGSEIDLRFTLPDDHVVSATGVVRYHQPGVGMGIEFVEISEDDRDRIKRWVDRLA